MKFIKSIASALLCAIVTSGYSFPSGTYTNTFVRNGTTYVQRGQLKPSDYVVTNVNVTAESIDALPLTGGALTGNLTLEYGGGASSPTLEVSGVSSRGIKLNADYGGKITVGSGSNGGGQIVLEDSSVPGMVEADVTIGTIKVRATLAEKSDKTNVYTKAEVDAKIENAVLPTNPSFSNAVLSIGLNIDTNSVAVLNEIAETFGGFPIEGTATTVGSLLAALAAAVAWLKKNKVGSFASVGGASATVENGVAKLDDFFTESNSLLNARITYGRNATGLKDRAFNTLSFDGTEFNLSSALEAVTPTASGQPRDLLIVATATAATTISFTAGTIKGDKPTIDGSGTWLITLTEYASGVWYCRQIKMEDAA